MLDVDADRTRANEYSERVPVILIDGAEHGYWRLEEPRFRAALQRSGSSLSSSRPQRSRSLRLYGCPIPHRLSIL